MNTKLIVCLLLCLLAVATANKKHQKGPVYASKKYQKLLHTVLSSNEGAAPLLQNVQALIQTKDTGYQKIHDIGTNIGNLYTILQQDQANDDAQFAADTKRINDAIDQENLQIVSLRQQRQVLRDKLTALNAERAKIEGIYQADRTAYHSRVTTQSELAQVLDELIQQATVGLLDNPIVPGLDNTNVSQVLAQVKQVGRGRPIEALVQLTNLFNKQDASDIITRFTNLQNAVYESMRIDTQKEDANLDLYNVLTNDIDNVLIPQVESQIKSLNDQIKTHKANIVVLQKQLADITSIYNQTKAERANAINYTSTASTELQNEVARLDAAGYTIE